MFLGDCAELASENLSCGVIGSLEDTSAQAKRHTVKGQGAFIEA
jgi:hypothetical protein